MASVGSGKYTYELVEGWGKLPDGWEFGMVVGVAVNSQDQIFVYHRGEHPMIVFDTDGNMTDSWGEDELKVAHGLFIDSDDNVYTTDLETHTVKKFTQKGELLMTIGKDGEPAEQMSGNPFNMPTDIAIGPSGDIFITDGYGNSRIHRFTPEGKHVNSWGETGSGPGQFNLPHGIFFDAKGLLYMGDRENSRIQVFTEDGDFVKEIGDLARPDDIYIDGDGIMFVSELGSFTGLMAGMVEPSPDSGAPPARVSVLDLEGNVLARWGGKERGAIGDFESPHAIWTDSRGDLYIGETLEGKRIQKFARVG